MNRNRKELKCRIWILNGMMTIGRTDPQDQKNFGGTAQEQDEYVEVDDDIDMNMSEEDINRTRNRVNRKRWERLRQVFHELSGEPLRKSDNQKLFEKTVIKAKASGKQELWYDGKRIRWKTKNRKEWKEYAEFAGIGICNW